MTLSIIDEDNHVLVVNKPAGIATMGAAPGTPTIHSMVQDYWRKKYDKPGNVFVGVVSRLDTMTSGVLVLARTSKAAARLQKQFAATDAESTDKIYLAIVQGEFGADAGQLVDWVAKDDAARRMRVVAADHADAKEATCDYLRLASSESETLLAVRLRTGRKHQIRVQLADRGHAVLGDRKYKAAMRFADGIALHSWRLRLRHPTLKDHRWYTCPPPISWKKRLQALGVGSINDQWAIVQEHFQLADD